jgi:hypothetical protein
MLCFGAESASSRSFFLDENKTVSLLPFYSTFNSNLVLFRVAYPPFIMNTVALGQTLPFSRSIAIAIGASQQSKTRLPRRARGRSSMVVRAMSDDEDIIPVVSGHRKSGFTPSELEQLRHPHLLGGKSVGEELALIREKYLEAEAFAETRVAEKLSSAQWDGDVWVGSTWNTLTVISMISMLSTAGIGVFAWLSYGHLWGITPELYM